MIKFMTRADLERENSDMCGMSVILRTANK